MALFCEARRREKERREEAARAEAERLKVFDAASRTWTDASGKFKIQAVFVKRIADVVTLGKRDGSTIQVRFDSLSEAGQLFLNLFDATRIRRKILLHQDIHAFFDCILREFICDRARHGERGA